MRFSASAIAVLLLRSSAESFGSLHNRISRSSRHRVIQSASTGWINNGVASASKSWTRSTPLYPQAYSTNNGQRSEPVRSSSLLFAHAHSRDSSLRSKHQICPRSSPVLRVLTTTNNPAGVLLLLTITTCSYSVCVSDRAIV